MYVKFEILKAINKGTNSLVLSKSEVDEWFVMCRCKMSAIKFAIGGSQDWWCRFPPSLAY